MIELDYLNLAFLLHQPTILTFPVGLALGATIGALLVNELRYKRKMKDDRIKIYSRLKGKKILLSQLFESTANYDIYIETNRALIKRLTDHDAIETIKRDDPELRKSFDRLTIELAKARMNLWTEIGLVEVLFDNHDIKEMADAIEFSERTIETFMYNLENEVERVKVEELSANLMISIYTSWCDDKIKELKGLIKGFERDVDALLHKIRPTI